MSLFQSSYLPYKSTGAFTQIILDYIEGKEALKPFYNHGPDVEGVKKTITERKQFNTNRALLVEEFTKQYAASVAGDKVKENIAVLANENTFTICTAHQPNIFTGHLYFIYKIVHAIRLAADLEEKIPGNRFVPVYYMGSEDADLEELGEVVINGKKYEWKTDQKGAVGRMKVDKAFIDIINAIDGQLSIEPFGKEIVSMIRQTYSEGKTIEQATFELVHELFGKYGLLVFLPDNPALKSAFDPISRKELNEQFSHQLVKETIAVFPEEYKVQAAGREINLFYLKDDTRERIEPTAKGYGVANSYIRFTKAQMCEELALHPDRFSPNVILRPVFQELILPNVIFIGGGGELAYWLELKKVFEAVAVPFPVLVLRNSFAVINASSVELMHKLELSEKDIFKPVKTLQENLVTKESKLQLGLPSEKEKLKQAYQEILRPVLQIDPTLEKHVAALSTAALQRIEALEKKMFKAEKKKFEAGNRQIEKLKHNLFPNNTLQERVDNLLPFYARWGTKFIDSIYQNSKGLQGEFCILKEMV